MLRRFGPLCMVLALTLPAQQEDPVALFRRATQKILLNIQRIPRYVCRQNVTRSRSHNIAPQQNCRELPPDPGSLQLTSVDRVHVDVMESNGQELFSWPGAHRFEAVNLHDLVGAGTAGSGDFSGFLVSLFAEGIATFRYEGRREWNGKVYAQYSYRVPREASHYRIDTTAGPEIAGYRGAVWIDPQTANLDRFSAVVDEPPKLSGACSFESQIDLQQLDLQGTPFLLPKTTILTVIDPAGNFFQNRTVYEGCQEYRSESKLSFGDPEPAAAEPPPLPSNPSLPPFPDGIRLDIDLKTELNFEQSATGDLIRGAVHKEAKAGTLTIPAGAEVSGRIMRLEKRNVPRHYFILSLRFDQITIGGRTYPLSLAALPLIEGLDDISGKALHLQLRPRGGEIGPFVNDRRPGLFTALFRGANELHVKPGFRTEWVTCAEYSPTSCAEKKQH